MAKDMNKSLEGVCDEYFWRQSDKTLPSHKLTWPITVYTEQ